MCWSLFSRFNGFPTGDTKPLKWFYALPFAITGLKPGVNEIDIHKIVF
jgi:hypothetical protein